MQPLPFTYVLLGAHISDHRLRQAMAQKSRCEQASPDNGQSLHQVWRRPRKVFDQPQGTLISTLAGQFVEALQQTFAFLLEFREICQGLHRHVAATAAHELRREHAQVIYQDAEFLALRGSEVHRSRHLKDLTAFVTYLIALCSIM